MSQKTSTVPDFNLYTPNLLLCQEWRIWQQDGKSILVKYICPAWIMCHDINHLNCAIKTSANCPFTRDKQLLWRLFAVCVCFFLQGQVMFRNGERMGTIKFTQFQGKSIRWSFFMVNKPFYRKCWIKFRSFSQCGSFSVLNEHLNLCQCRFVEYVWHVSQCDIESALVQYIT